MFDIDDNLWLAESVYKNVSNDFLKTRKAKLHKNTLPWMKEGAKSFTPREVNIDPTFYRITPSTGD